MVEISDRSSGAGFIAAAGIKRGARALSQLSQAAGREVELTQTSLRPQANNLSRLGTRLGQIAGALNGIEEARGIVRSEELTDALRRATSRAVNRLLQVEGASNASAASATLGISGKASIADVVKAGAGNSAGSAIASVLARALQSGASKKATPISIIATAAAAGRDLGDIFERQLPTRVQAQGRATVEITRRALEAQTTNVVIDPSDADAFLPNVTVVDSGRATPSNEGFVVKASTGDRSGTLVLDMNDASGEDGRLSIITATGGDGSDVIFLSGANNAVVRAGAGNDYVSADGNAEIYGGTGDDILAGNITFGDEGDDVLFGNALAVGGTGNDRITMFALDEEADGASNGLAFGGEGDDIIVGEVAISADGGDGNDAITLRAGGFANGGAGDDFLTAFDNATLEGGAGNDDLMLLANGAVDAGDGNDEVTATFYSTVTGGKGDDLVRMNTGGIYRFSKGDGTDQLLMGSTLGGQIEDWEKTNRIELSGFARGDVDIFISTNEITIVSRDPAIKDRISLTRSLPGDAIEIVFTKDKKTQTLSITGNASTLGAQVPVLDPVA